MFLTNTDASYTSLVRLVIIDENRRDTSLHAHRGPALESIVTRTVCRMEQTREYVRLVGLSATLPNWRNVAASYHPCGLQQQFIGITEKKAIKL